MICYDKRNIIQPVYISQGQRSLTVRREVEMLYISRQSRAFRYTRLRDKGKKRLTDRDIKSKHPIFIPNSIAIFFSFSSQRSWQ